MDLRRLIGIARARLPVLVLAVVIAAAAAFVASGMQPRVFASRATLIVGPSLSAANPDYSQLLVSQRLAATYAALATTRPILEGVIASLALATDPAELAERVRAEAPIDSSLITIAAEDGDPASAAAIANAIAQSLIEASPAIQGKGTAFQASIDADLAATRGQILDTQAELDALAAVKTRTPDEDLRLQRIADRLASLRATYATLLAFATDTSASMLTVVEPAEPSLDPISPRVLLNTVVAALLGLVVVAVAVLLVEYLDDRVKDSAIALEVTGFSTLGSIGRMTGDRGRRELYRLAPLLYPRSSDAEAYRTLRTNVEFASIDAPVRTLLVTSARPGEGKTITASNLAIVFAQAGHDVLLVDGDLRKPGIHVAFGLENKRGLTTLIRDDRVPLASVAARSEQADLRILPTGPLPPNPAELMGSQRMRVLVDRLRAEADLVIFDSPPLQAVSDSAVLSSYLDGTLLVVDAERTRRRSLRLAADALATAGASVLGIVLNRDPARVRTEDLTYAGYYGYRDGSEPAPVPKVADEGPAPRRPRHARGGQPGRRSTDAHGGPTPPDVVDKRLVDHAVHGR